MPLTAVRALADDPAGFDRGWWARGCDLGWTSLLVAEADGGGSLGGEGVLDLVIVAEEMGRLVSPGPLAPTNVVADAVSRSGTPELRSAVLPGIIAGDVVGAWCGAGPGGGWDGTGGAVTARRDGAEFVLDGVSTPVEAAVRADELLVTARPTAGSPSSWCPRGPPGWRSNPSVPSTSSVATPPCASTTSGCPTGAWSATSTAPTPRWSVSCSSPSSCSARRRWARSTAWSSSRSSTSPTATRSDDPWRRTRRSSTASPT